jgi:hypothetical protein
MNLSMKGALLSGLVFPGIGHIFLKQYRRGTALIIASFVCLVVMIVNMVQKSLAVLEKLKIEGGVVDMDKINELVSQSSRHSDNFYFNLAVVIISFCWIFGIVDAYNIGKKPLPTEK